MANKFWVDLNGLPAMGESIKIPRSPGCTKPVKIWWHKLPILNRCMISEVSTVGVFGSSSSMKRLVTLKLTCQPSKKDMDYLPSMHFQMRTVSLMEGSSNYQGIQSDHLIPDR